MDLKMGNLCYIVAGHLTFEKFAEPSQKGHQLLPGPGVCFPAEIWIHAGREKAHLLLIENFVWLEKGGGVSLSNRDIH